MRALVVAVFLAGCAADGRPIRAWTLDAPAGPHGAAVTLPGNMFEQLRLTETAYTLRTTVDLDAAERQGPMTVEVAYTRLPIALSVDGQKIEDRGDAAAGEHRFVVDAGGRATLTLELATEHSAITPPLEVAPIMRRGTARASSTAVFNRYSNLVALVVAAIVGFLYLVLSVLDRRRREYPWVAAASLASVAIAAVQLGVLDGAAAAVTSTLSSAITFWGVIAIAYIIFDWGRPPRAWRWVLTAYGALPLAYLAPAPVAAAAALTSSVVPVAVYVDMTLRLGRVVSRHGADARFLLGAYLFAAFATAAESITALSGKNPLSGVHLIGAAMVLLLLAQLVVLGRQHVTRTHALDKVADELQRQVAARSKDLADALARIATKPRSEPTAATVIDGRYRVLRKLGAGGMGSVHEVERVTDGEKLALKLIRGEAAPEVLARFAREAHIAAELRHANLVPVIDVGIAAGEMFLVMPLVDGGSLADARSQYGELAWSRRILRDVATGLVALHERGIVHRDLKPGNILVSSGIARIADFGLAYFAQTSRAGAADGLESTVTGLNPVTRIGDVFGTPRYMAPELISGVHAAGPETDVFSFGVIAFEIVAARLPFREPPMVAALAGRAPEQANVSSIDPSMRSIVERCLSFDPKLRPTARELVDLLG